jgi:hypothetical protein
MEAVKQTTVRESLRDNPSEKLGVEQPTPPWIYGGRVASSAREHSPYSSDGRTWIRPVPWREPRVSLRCSP